jgi:hydroxymethylbilane synthase
MKTLKLGICDRRVSRSAAETVREQLQDLHRDLTLELIPIESCFDYSPEDPEAHIRAKEKALLDSKIDVAMHLLKEIPVSLPEAIRLCCVTERLTPFDTFISSRHKLLDDLPPGAKVGYSHLRQKVQLMLFQPDLKMVEIHGSVDSVLQQLESRDLAGILVSAEKLELIGLQEQVCEVIADEIILPAPGQGCLGFLTRRGDTEIEALLKPVNDRTSRFEAMAERSFLGHLGGNPEIAIGVRAALDSNLMIIEGFLATEDGSHYIRDAIQGLPEQAELLGSSLAQLLLTFGGKELEQVAFGSP